eukprot:CAMPEP_0114594690 /NCGR_PEP_ID=MMETSP0125-20121206/16371_1 /TAXON_ID=485358 ORGANISM="Aristerostoma sp., Strain ATCC 50986" /NCGR_SAMPLE_ID=MMETSP0125 /ASSEMBLY_ACC=CAM_ASM_000245 /LENGTH=155 /DNA_ID=CAMNT_0001795295 /DNA_START=1718 /DNA_END=2185 /DNA_ORIENTATION=+
MIDDCMAVWRKKKHKILEKIRRHKEIFVEPEDAVAVKEVIQNFKLKAKNHGAVMFGSCRGKVFEGIDFTDNEARGVVLLGVPNAKTTDIRVQSKINLLNKRKKGGEKELMNGQQWYRDEMIRSMNQSVGRIFRHSEDYGAIFLVDSRFLSENLDP